LGCKTFEIAHNKIWYWPQPIKFLKQYTTEQIKLFNVENTYIEKKQKNTSDTGIAQQNVLLDK